MRLVSAPAPASIDDDGVEDFAGVFRRPDGLHELIAVDGARFRPIWRRPLGALTDGEPVILRWVGEARAESLFLAAGQTVRSFSRTTGLPSGEWKLRAPVRRLCAYSDGWSGPTARARADTATDASVILDPTTRALLAPSPTAARCTDFPPCHHRPQLWDCALEDVKPLGTVLSRIDQAVETRDVIVNIGFAPSSATPPTAAPVYGVFWSKPKSEVVWEGRLSLPEDVAARPRSATRPSPRASCSHTGPREALTASCCGASPAAT